ncbi:putative bifunctional diguanylate cyclase/phosphodiesterase [Pseudidiomarina mangrovi]|uniref:putative bifunctional diguanylate cyclase/phosphodiesterase n=1 Tax=Pseudidiomarina mangrovi TaxID=2487133 RepID=UPI000FCA9E6C|nr:GGDEF domain-containing phosphodiesterase [Pseudidiomarina mangrovi]
MTPNRAAALITLCYGVLGVLWINFSDQALLALVDQSELLTQLQTYKGLTYVLVTALMLYALVYSALARERTLNEQDSLTHLLNRHMFDRALEIELKFSKKQDQPLVLMLLNIDGFKQINSNASLQAGDLYLKAFALLLRDHFQQRVIIGRIGGDEFAVALPSTLWPDGVIPLAEQLQQKVRQLAVEGLPDLHLTVSIGMALFPRDGDSSRTLIDEASLALEEAKSAGPNHIRTYRTAYREHANHRARLLMDLKRALAADELSVMYQPQFSAQNGLITGVEVLLRWYHPQHGWISPDQFIPLAEQHGVISEITDFVMRRALHELHLQRLLYHDVQRVSFNVSAADFNSERSLERFQRNLEGLHGGWSVVQLELTETSALLNMERIRKVLSGLRERGVQVSLDDFGTGYSSLSTLRQLPIQELKIDKSFIRDIGSNLSDAKIVRTILAMANALNLRVVAEGVETPQQARFLQQEGCQEMQGYLYARPMTIDALLSFIQNHKTTRKQF